MKSSKVKMSMVPAGAIAQDLQMGHLDPMDMHMGLRDLRDDFCLFNSASDWEETAEEHILTAQLPGLTREELKVEVEDNRVLQISGGRRVERVETTNNSRREERSSGKFVRRIKLPDCTDAEQVKASLEKGVLTVSVPKMQAQRNDV